MIYDPHPLTRRAEDRADADPVAAMIQHMERLNGLVDDANYLVELVERFAANPLDMLDRLQKSAVGLAKQAGAAHESGEMLSRARRAAGHFSATYSEVHDGR